MRVMLQKSDRDLNFGLADRSKAELRTDCTEALCPLDQMILLVMLH